MAQLLIMIKICLPVSQMICANLIKSAHESGKGHPLLLLYMVTSLIKHL